MKRTKSVTSWMRDGWPFYVVLLLVGIHITLHYFPNIDIKLTNDIIGEALPLFGGIITLLSIAKDIQEFRGTNIWSLVKKYWQSCPWKKQNYVLSADSVSYSLNVSKPTLSVINNWSTTDDGLKELERRLEESKKIMAEIKKDNEDEHTKIWSALRDISGKNYEDIQQVSDRLDRTVMGNINYQILGIFLIFYGFVVKIISLFS